MFFTKITGIEVVKIPGGQLIGKNPHLQRYQSHVTKIRYKHLYLKTSVLIGLKKSFQLFWNKL